MIIKEAKYRNVKTIQRKRISDEIYGCDQCRKEIENFPNEDARLQLTVFKHDSESYSLHFCSWKCVLKYLPSIKTDYFATLPYIYYDQNTRNIGELIKALKK